MEKELINFISKNSVMPFGQKAQVKPDPLTIFKTPDAKAIHKKLISIICSNFAFENTGSLMQFFSFSHDYEQIKKRQNFFSSLPKNLDNSLLKSLSSPKPFWKPKYSIIIATENESTFLDLKSLNCPVQLLSSQNDLNELAKYDIIQAIDCDEFSQFIDSMPQSIFLNSADEIYLERHLETLSGWKKNIEILSSISHLEISSLASQLSGLLSLIEDNQSKKISRDYVETAVEKINKEISEKIKEFNISGESLFSVLSRGRFPKEIEAIIENAISKAKIPSAVFKMAIPVEIDESEFESIIKKQELDEFTDIALSIGRNAEAIKKVPEKIKELSEKIILLDFIAGISKFISSSSSFPKISQNLKIENSENIFLINPQPVSFLLNESSKGSILTGANSGGKTTLLEHIIQLISMSYIGLPAKGSIEIPLFSEVYYFAKNKGALNKGAFENLLSQLSKIQPGKHTLILADEIESVTEPGVAGSIICATVEYFTSKNCFMVIATHLGKHIEHNLPALSRIDGIEAKGLDDNLNLIVDHNPILGRLAHSTPELIIEKMAKSNKNSGFFAFLDDYIKK